jgi:ABC-type uncharacterized transport system involved in gliding motility auxiliary subunit
MKTEWMQARQTKFMAYAVVYVLIFTAVLVVVNFLANRYNKSYDATSNKRFSLSDQTVKLLKDLKQDVNISYFDAPSGFQGARDLLDRYSNVSPKVHVRYVDVYKNPTVARAAGVTRTGEAVVELGTKHEEAKTFDEQGITGALIRDIKGGARTVCSVQGSGEHQFDDTGKNGLSKFKDAVARDNYETKGISLLQKAEVPSECTVLVVAGPLADYVQPEVDAIRKYIENGGRALFMLDPPLKVGRTDIAENAPLVAVLTSWGVTPDSDLILDQNPVGQLMGLGPEVPIVTSYESHAIVNEMKTEATGFPLARSLTVKNGDKTSVDKLFSSSTSSFATVKLNSPEIKPDEKTDKKGPLVMGAAGTYNTGKPNNQGRFVVIGNSGWAANSFLAFNGNRDLLLNVMNWLSSDEDLISIRPKEQEDRRINLTRAQMSWIRVVSQYGLPLVVIVAGFSIWWRRR